MIENIKKILIQNKTKLEKEFRVKKLGIFGSYVKNMQKIDSDIDILVDFSESVSLLDIVKLENFLNVLLNLKVDVVPKQDIRLELKERILKETVYV